LDAIRVGDDFYAISSTIQVSPGMAVLHSKDLVNWKVISHVVKDLTKSIKIELE
jgi:beta-xylosidase